MEALVGAKWSLAEVGLIDSGLGSHESRRYSRDAYLESCITEYTRKHNYHRCGNAPQKVNEPQHGVCICPPPYHAGGIFGH